MARRSKTAHARAIGPLTADGAARLIAAAADITLVLDDDGVVQDCLFRTDALQTELEPGEPWKGRDLASILTVESRPKVAPLLKAARGMDDPALRHVNHSSPDGKDIAVEYAAVQVEPTGPIVAFGRDLRPLSNLQQRLVDAQHAMARTYAMQRQAETRFRTLFETSPDPLLVLDAQSFRVLEANSAARKLSGFGRRASGWPATQLFVPADQVQVQRFLAAARNAGAAPIQARLAGTGTGTEAGAGLQEDPGQVTVSASFLVEEPASVVLLRIHSVGPVGRSAPAEFRERLLTALELAPDGFAFTDGSGDVEAVNGAFLAMTQVSTEDKARGRKLGTWLGQPGVDMEVLLANLRQRGSLQQFGTTLRGEFGQVLEVEVSAVAVDDPAGPSFGFAFRDVGRRIPASAVPSVAPVPRSVEQLTELIGRVPLKDLVRDATDVIERLCIEAALELTGDNRASAAEMLGLSRQSLYVKLRRYGLGDLDELNEPDGSSTA